MNPNCHSMQPTEMVFNPAPSLYNKIELIMMTPEQVVVVRTYSAQPHPFAMATRNCTRTRTRTRTPDSRLEVYPSPHMRGSARPHLN